MITVVAGALLIAVYRCQHTVKQIRKHLNMQKEVIHSSKQVDKFQEQMELEDHHPMLDVLSKSLKDREQSAWHMGRPD